MTSVSLVHPGLNVDIIRAYPNQTWELYRFFFLPWNPGFVGDAISNCYGLYEDSTKEILVVDTAVQWL